MRWKSVLCAMAFIFALASAIICHAETPCLIGLYADPMHCDLSVFTEYNYAMVDVWVWMRPSDVGLMAAEFRIVPIPNTIPLFDYRNPDLLGLVLGDPWSGVSVAFTTCRMDWTWTHRLVVLVPYQPTYGFWRIEGRPDAEPYFIQYASCEVGYPIYPMTVLNYLALNQCALISGCRPRVRAVAPIGASALRVTFDSCVNTQDVPYADRFHLFLEGSTVEAMDVIDARQISDAVFDLALDGAMTDGATYVLVAKSIRDCDEYSPWFESSSRKFVCVLPIATLLQDSDVSIVDGAIEVAWSLSEIDPGATFYMLRSADGGAFEALGGIPVEDSPQSYRYFDASVEPGRDYIYRVEYSTDGERRILFTSNRIAMPAEQLALRQNVPNPFNPSTTISFTLPEACAATLEIYDVTGRLVARLLDGERLSGGAHHVDWNGRNDEGNAAVSGIYFCRLVAAKEIASRKMILLR